MLGPALSRFALRLIGLVLGAWSVARAAGVLLLWDVDGRWREVAHLAALVVAGWAVYDLLVAIALLTAQSWARYPAFLTVALHFALGYLLRQQHAFAPIGLGIMVGCAVCAVILVLARPDAPDAPPPQV
jgi:hypothetical protein